MRGGISKICCALIYCLLRLCLKTNSKIIFLAFFARKNMPFVEYDVKLDFKDVLFRPKRSSLKSRSQVLTFCKEDL